MHAALPVQMEDVFAGGLIGIDDDLVKHRAQDPLLQVGRGVRMMPQRREVVAELKDVLPLLGGQDSLRVGERGEVRFELADADERIVHRTSSSPATRRLSGSTVWYWRSARCA